MKILVDADACPVKQLIVKAASESHIPVTMVIDTSHELDDGYSTVITVDTAMDSVDIKLINLVEAGDIVVTQDFGVAAMALAKKAAAINQNGMIYDSSNMDKLLFERHLGRKVRRSGGRSGSHPKRTKDNDVAFDKEFRKIIGLLHS